jgi:ureidoglycolate amidohydrolase
MISRAYHDSLFLSRIAPAAMLFIHFRGGVSHSAVQLRMASRYFPGSPFGPTSVADN